MIRAIPTHEIMPHWLHSQHGDKLLIVDDEAMFQDAGDPETVWLFTPPDGIDGFEPARAKLGLTA